MMWLIGLPALIVLGFGLYVRLAPSDAARWHVSPVTDTAADCAVQTARDSARWACILPAAPAEALAALDAIALATPRTARLAGSPDEGRITWVTRTALWGFPDYTTAEARVDGQGARIDLWARQRFGGDDWGVNTARLADWSERLAR